uniref:Uncharacterized protein n=1 Tax=Anguilla anguilla TaxID=7936 RepID=A0A0E9X0Z6_ANGAN
MFTGYTQYFKHTQGSSSVNAFSHANVTFLRVGCTEKYCKCSWVTFPCCLWCSVFSRQSLRTEAEIVVEKIGSFLNFCERVRLRPLLPASRKLQNESFICLLTRCAQLQHILCSCVCRSYFV